MLSSHFVTCTGRGHQRHFGCNCVPPALLTMSLAKEEDTLYLVYYESDELCNWRPSREQLEKCCTEFTYIMNESSAYKGHFGASDHGHAHWLGLDLPGGMLQLSQLFFLNSFCPSWPLAQLILLPQWYLVSHSGSPDTCFSFFPLFASLHISIVFSSLPVFGLSILLCRL